MSTTRRHRRRHSPEQIAKTRRNHVLLLGLLVLIVFASTLGGDFVWHDRDDILQGAHRITSLADVPEALSSSREAYRARLSGRDADAAVGTWQPLTLLSNSLSWLLWGDCALCFHLENLILHGLMVIGVYALGRHLLALRRHGVRLAAWAAALFAVHPATVNTVAWIGGRPYLLAAVLVVWSLVLFTRLPATTRSQARSARQWLLGLSAAALAAMLAHESAYLLPVLGLLIAMYESRERGRHPLGGISPRRLQGLAVMSGALVFVIAYRSSILGGLSFPADYPTESALNNLGTALRHFWFLVELTFVPAEPIVSDSWRITLGWGAGEVAALLGLLVLLAAILGGLYLDHPSAIGGAWFVLAIVPGVGIFPSAHYHDSQTLYLAIWGATFALTYGIARLWRPIGRQLMPGSEAIVFVPLLVVLSVITGLSNARWWNHEGLFESEIASDPHYMEGRLELAEAALERGEPTAALNHVLAAIEASRNENYTGYWSARDAYYLAGRAQWEMDLFTEAAGSLTSALQESPGDADVLYWLGLAQLSMQEFGPAEASFRQALAARPAFPNAAADLGVTLVGQQRFVEAYPLLADAIAQDLGNARRHRAMALTLIDANRLQEAAQQLELALAMREDADERARLAWVSWRLGEMEKARSDLNMALMMEEESSPYVDWVRVQMQSEPDAAEAD